jgi:nitrite reductase/ring-hydroxylating ferredoxin subunit
MPEAPARTVIGGVGYTHLCDHSLGIVLADELAGEARPPALLVEDLSYGPVAVAQWFLDEARLTPIGRAVLVSAVARDDGRPPGTVSAYRWDRVLPPPEAIQQAVADAVTGVILLDNTLVVGEWMRALPNEVVVVEVEPLVHAFGDDFSPPVAAAYVEARRLVRLFATDDAAADALPVLPLGGAWAATDVLARAEQRIATLSAHPDREVGRAVTALLEDIDAVHRTALTHLLGAIQSMAGEAFVNRLTADPAIRLLLMSYDLLAVDRRTLAEEALDAVRGHLHAHAIDVELVDVVGGVVTVRLHGAPAPDDPTYAAVVRDLEAALRADLLGFQQLEVDDGTRARGATSGAGFVPLDALQRARRPVYRSAGRADVVTPGTMRGVVIDGVPVLIARVEDDFFAVRNACGESPLPLDYGTLRGTELTCSWHGCRYDVRTGHRLDRADAAPEERLDVLPVRVHDGVIEVAVGTSNGAKVRHPA